jgi:hypothetical protein
MARKITAALVGAAALMALLAVVPAAPASAGGRNVCGTVRGDDGRYVRATVAAVLYQGTTVVDVDGGGGFSLDTTVNPTMPTDQGVEPGSPEDTGFTDTFCLEGIPVNVTHLHLEVYPRDGSGATSFARYGGATRSREALPAAGLSGLALQLPVRCDQGGTAGSMQVQAFRNGQPTTVDRVVVTSEGPSPSSGVQGFTTVGDSTVDGADGPVSPLAVHGLEPDQRYRVEVTFFHRTRRSVFTEIAVRSCETTPVRAWTGSTPAGTPGRWASRPMAVNGTYVPVPGDFTGDGRTDVFFYAPGAPMDYLWEASGAGAGFVTRPFPVNGVYVPTAGDYDGDGVDDLYFFGPGTAPDHKWYFDEGGASYTSVPDPAFAASTTTTRSGDFDGNGVDDVLFYTPTGGDAVWRHTAGGAHTSVPLVLGGASNVTVGDVDGDGRTDIYQQSTITGGTNLLLGDSGGGFTIRPDSAVRTYRPIMGDFSCDLRADVFMYQPGPAPDVLWRGRSGIAPYFVKGAAALGINGSYLYPFTGDFDGNGCEDVFWYQPGAGADWVWLNDAIGWHLPTSTIWGSF